MLFLFLLVDEASSKHNISNGISNFLACALSSNTTSITLKLYIGMRMESIRLRSVDGLLVFLLGTRVFLRGIDQ